MALGVSAVDVAVVGGGVIGAACARAAALRGLRALVLDPGHAPGAASPASAGMLAAQIEPADDALLRLAVRARDQYITVVPALEHSTGIAVGLRREGIAALALDDALRARLERDAARQQAAGLVAHWLAPADVRARWPGVSPACRGAFFSPQDGALNPAALARALLADAVRLGATIVPESVAEVRVAEGRAEGVATPTRSVAARHVVIAAGAWSPLLPGLPRRLPVEPVRGQLVATPWPAATPPAILYHEHCYVLFRDGEAVLGSTMDRAGFDAAPASAATAGIVRRAAAILPALAGAPVLRTWAGLRPVTPDGRPIVGADPAVDGLWYATGHGRNGILLAALTGDVVGDLLASGTTSVDISAWRADRFDAGAVSG